MDKNQVSEKQTEGDEGKRLVTLGRISGLHGVQGWVKIFSHTSPRENILQYSPWLLKRQGEWQEWLPQKGRPQGKTVVAKLEGCDNREEARELMGADIAVPRSALAATDTEDDYYWADLEGLVVSTTENIELGRLDHLFETGSNDVMVIKGERERFVPYIWQQVVKEVDLQQGTMLVEWDAEF